MKKKSIKRWTVMLIAAAMIMCLLPNLSVFADRGAALNLLGLNKGDTSAGCLSGTIPYGSVQGLPLMLSAQNELFDFKDVVKADYFYDAVSWAVSKGITKGTTEKTFSPNDKCTRAQMVTFLWRKAGCPKAIENADNRFSDVKSTDYFYEAVMWATGKNITNGIDKKHFAPNAEVKRCEAITFLYRYYGIEEKNQPENNFTDIFDSDYFYNAVMWGVDRGIVKGISEKEFGPNVLATRAHIVTFLYRYEETKMEMKIAVIGDSLSDYYRFGDKTGKMSDATAWHYYPTSELKYAEKMWYNVLASKLNAYQDLYNYKVSAVDAITGSMVCESSEVLGNYAGPGLQMWSDNRLARLALGGDPDIIIVEGGTNDYNRPDILVNSLDGKLLQELSAGVFKENYKHLIDKIKDKYPKSQVICLTIYDFGSTDDGDFRKAVIDTAKEKGVQYVDMSNVVNQGNISEITYEDRLHLNIKGQEAFGTEIFKTCFGK